MSTYSISHLDIDGDVLDRLNGISKDLYGYIAAGLWSEVLHSIRPATIFYTDGSKSENNIGCAYYSGPQCGAGFWLNKFASVYTAELSAILFACEHIREGHAPGKYVVASDSLSAVRGLAGANVLLTNERTVAYKIKTVIRGLHNSGFDILIMWVPAHSGIIGNERADLLAKSGSEGVSFPILRTEISDVSMVPKTELLETCQGAWNSGVKGLFTFSILPNVTLRPWFLYMEAENCRSYIVAFSRMLFNHVARNDHLNRMNVAASPLCDVC